MMALAPIRPSVSTISCRRHSSGSGATIKRAQHAEQRDHALDGVGKLQSDHSVGGKPQPAQPGGKGRNSTVGLGIGQSARRPVGEALAVVRIEQRQVFGLAHAGGALQLIERGAVAGRLALCVAQNHEASPRHQVSGR